MRTVFAGDQDDTARTAVQMEDGSCQLRHGDWQDTRIWSASEARTEQNFGEVLSVAFSGRGREKEAGSE